jgi:hypothetical protein
MGRWAVMGLAWGLGSCLVAGSASACWCYGLYPGGYMVVTPGPVVGYGSSWGMGCRPLAGPAVVWVVPVVPVTPVRPPRVETIPSGRADAKGEASRPDPQATRDGFASPKGNISKEGKDGSGIPKRDPRHNEVGGGNSGSKANQVPPPFPPVQPLAGQEPLPPLSPPASQESLPPLKLPNAPVSPSGNNGVSDRLPPPALPLPPSPPAQSSPRNNSDTLPPLTLPPEIPPVVPPTPGGTGASTSRYRPERETSTPSHAAASAHPSVRFQVWSRPPTPDGYRMLRFLNYTDRAVALQVEGQQVTVPARSQLPVWVGPVVRWQLADGEVRQWVFPAEVGEVDIVFSSVAVRSSGGP